MTKVGQANARQGCDMELLSLNKFEATCWARAMVQETGPQWEVVQGKN